MGTKGHVIVCDELPDFRNFYYAKIGSFALTTANNRYIAKEDLVDYNGIQETVSWHYRQTIKDIWFERRDPPDKPITYPYYARPMRLPVGVYVDIRRAFQQIGCAYGYEIVLKEGQFMAYGSTLPDQPLLSTEKTARGLVITAHAKESSFTEWRNNELHTVKFFNQAYAPHLRYAIWRTLHAIMAMVKPYVYYVHTDGFIVPFHFLPKVETLLCGLGLSYAIKATGLTRVRGVGSYQVGEFLTRNVSKGGAADNIISDEFDKWWLDKFTNGLALQKALSFLSDRP